MNNKFKEIDLLDSWINNYNPDFFNEILNFLYEDGCLSRELYEEKKKSITVFKGELLWYTLDQLLYDKKIQSVFYDWSLLPKVYASLTIITNRCMKIFTHEGS